MHRFTGDSDDSQLYRAGEVMALMEISKQKGEEKAADIARITVYRWFATGCLTGAGVILLIQRFA